MVIIQEEPWLTTYNLQLFIWQKATCNARLFAWKRQGLCWKEATSPVSRTINCLCCQRLFFLGNNLSCWAVSCKCVAECCVCVCDIPLATFPSSLTQTANNGSGRPGQTDTFKIKRKNKSIKFHQLSWLQTFVEILLLSLESNLN